MSTRLNISEIPSDFRINYEHLKAVLKEKWRRPYSSLYAKRQEQLLNHAAITTGTEKQN